MSNKDITVNLKKNDNTWEQIYGNAINNRLRKDNNLSDVNDKAESRKNLEIIGDDNTTHFHDSRYLPKINAEAKKREKEDTDIKNTLNREIADRKNDTAAISKAIVDSENRVNNNVTSTKNELNNNMNTVQNNLTSKMDDLKDEVKKNDIGTRTITTPGGSNLSNNMPVSATTTTTIKQYQARDYISSGTYTIEDLLNKLAQASHVHALTNTTTVCKCNCVINNKCSNSH